MAGKSVTGKSGSASSQLIAELTSRHDPAQAAHLMRFFKTGPWQNGEGDRLLGIKVPVTRGIIRDYRNTLTDKDYAALFASEWHEVRLAGFLLLGDDAARLGRCRAADGLAKVVRLYDTHLDRANNWDLVDLSVYDIMGPYWDVLETPPDAVRDFLRRWADSGKLWRERAAMVSTYARNRRCHMDEVFWR
ncbi:MAG: DNA alkylation repair protein, partial [Planctomycetes bacterium]|nr:DNA alkylation repair protein [Planctomycetota bacterium]